MALQITLNGETKALDRALSVRGLLESLGLDPAKIAVERNLEIVPRSRYGEVALSHGDRLEIVHFIGTGKYKTYADNAAALEASGAEIVTVAVRRVNLTDPGQPMLVDFIDPKKVTYLPNTAGCFTGEEAVRT